MLPQWHIAESELFFFFFYEKGQDLVSCIPYVGVYEVHVSMPFFFQSTENLSFFKNHLNEFNDFNCLVSMDRLFNCLSVDGKKKEL